MSEKRFKAAVVAMTPDADPATQRCVIGTPKYSLTSVLVKDEEEAVEVCQDLVRVDCVQSFLLCPGFTNQGVAKVAAAVGAGVSVNVARGDAPSNAIAQKLMREAGFARGR